MKKRELTETEIRDIAHAERADVRTVRSVLAGDKVERSGLVRDRIARAIEALVAAPAPAIRRGDSAGGVKRGE